MADTGLDLDHVRELFDSSTDFTIGAGTASTVNGPVTRVLLLSMYGWS